MKRLANVLVALVITVTAGYGAFSAVRSFRGESEAEPAAQAATPAAQDELQAIVDADSAKPRFNGELLGIYVAPTDADVPNEYRAFHPECGLAGAPMTWAEAGNLDVSVTLPPDFRFDPNDHDSGVVAWACTEEVYYAARAYRFGGNDGPKLIISRGAGRYMHPNASIDRVKVISAGGREAVLIEPMRQEGYGRLGGAGTNAAVVFPEPFGKTVVQSYAVPLSELLAVAELVGEATRQ